MTLRSAKRWPRGTASTTSSRKNGSKTTPRWRRTAPTTPSSTSRRATCSITRCVSDTESATCTPGLSCWNSASATGSTVPPGPVERADLEPPGQLALDLLAQLGEELLLEREQALCAPVEPAARIGRLDAPPGAVEQLQAEPLLERPDLEAHRRLGDAELLGGLGEAPPLDDDAERCKLARVHKQSLCTG